MQYTYYADVPCTVLYEVIYSFSLRFSLSYSLATFSPATDVYLRDNFAIFIYSARFSWEAERIASPRIAFSLAVLVNAICIQSMHMRNTLAFRAEIIAYPCVY